MQRTVQREERRLVSLQLPLWMIEAIQMEPGTMSGFIRAAVQEKLERESMYVDPLPRFPQLTRRPPLALLRHLEDTGE